MHVRVETVVRPSRLQRFRAVPEAEGRVLLLIDAFSGSPDKPKSLEGRVKLAKLDFLVRYPKYLARVLQFRNVNETVLQSVPTETNPIQDRMIRYRYGPWDPAYYAVLGSLIGRGLIVAVPTANGIGYRTTQEGRALAGSLAADDVWEDVRALARLVKRHLDYSGSSLKDWLYAAIPEMANAEWHDELE